ncbi:MAG: redoxin domain-containing protein, partial [Chloroflexia bacterium]
MNPPHSALRLGGKVPLFYLPTTGGGTSGPAATRSKYNLVLVFLTNGPQAESYLRELSRLYPDLLRNDARVIAVLDTDLETTRNTAAALDLPFALLSDENGTTASRIMGQSNRAGLCIADRYGVTYSIQPAPTTATLPPASTALE